MNLNMMIDQLKDRRDYNESQVKHYEEEHAKHVLNGGGHSSVWSEMADWHKGKVIAFGLALDMAMDCITEEDPGAFSADAVDCF